MRRRANKNAAPKRRGVFDRKEEIVLGWPGDDLLSRVLRHSTIGAEAFNGRVRDGIGFRRLAQITGPAKDNWQANRGLVDDVSTDMDHESDQADRAISTGKLNASPRLHTRPINVVVFHGSQGRNRFEVGFPLRCIQRLSRPYIATLHCGWRHNSSTRGMSIPVLSY